MKWISVKERLPESRVDVLVLPNTEGAAIEIARWIDEMQRWAMPWGKPGFAGASAVSHWMPLPKPPKATDHRAESKREGREL